MGDTILLRHGTAANLPDLQEGEPGYATDTHKFYIGTDIGTAEGAIEITGYEIDALAYLPNTFTQATIEAALTAIGTVNKVTLLLRPGTWVISSNADWSAYTNVTVKIVPGAILQIASGMKVTFGGPVDAGRYQIFSHNNTDGVLFNATSSVAEVYPEWWATNTTPGTTDMSTAIQSAIASFPIPTGSGGDLPDISIGGTVSLGRTTYKLLATTPVIVPVGVFLRGQGMYATKLYNANVSGGSALYFYKTTTDAERLTGGSDFQLRGNALSGHGIVVEHMNYVTFRDIITGDNGLSGIYIGLNSVHGSWSNVYSEGNGEWGAWIDDNQSTTHNFHDCAFRANGLGGMRNGGTACTSSGRTVFESNAGGPGLLQAGTDGSFINPYFENNDTTSTNRYDLLIQGYSNFFFQPYMSTGKIRIEGVGGTNNQIYSSRLSNVSPNVSIGVGANVNEILFSGPIQALDLADASTGTVIISRDKMQIDGGITIGGDLALNGKDIYQDLSTGYIQISGDTVGAGAGVTVYATGHASKAGVVETRGNIWPSADDTYYIGKNDDDTPFAFKGAIFKDQVNGKYYRLEIKSGIVTATDLTD